MIPKREIEAEAKRVVAMAMDGVSFKHPILSGRDAEIRNAALEEAAQAAERDTDWSRFGKADIGQWDGGPDEIRDYRIGIAAGRAIAAAIRALKSPEKPA